MAAKADKTAIFTEREARRSAHVLAQVRKYRMLPFLKMDANLLDLSTGGLKIEFQRDVRAKEDDVFWIEISAEDEPLVLRAKCRWYAKDSRTLGGTFSDLDEDTRKRLDELIARFIKDGKLAC